MTFDNEAKDVGFSFFLIKRSIRGLEYSTATLNAESIHSLQKLIICLRNCFLNKRKHSKLAIQYFLRPRRP